LTPGGIIHRRPAKGPANARPHAVGRPTRHAAAALPARILDAAEALFLAQGFEATSLNQIAERVGVTKRTLYVKVGDKAELFAAMVRRMLARHREKLGEPGPDVPVAARLAGFGEDLLAMALDPDVLSLLRVLAAEAHRFPELAQLMEEQMTQGAHRRLAELLCDEARRGRLTLADPETAARLLLNMIIGAPQRTMLFGLQRWEAAMSSDWVAAAVALFLRGCERRG
jgi:AcrR family transcriptional regulator